MSVYILPDATKTTLPTFSPVFAVPNTSLVPMKLVLLCREKVAKHKMFPDIYRTVGHQINIAKNYLKVYARGIESNIPG